jgi:hypothetical protein
VKSSQPHGVAPDSAVQVIPYWRLPWNWAAKQAAGAPGMAAAAELAAGAAVT